MVSCSKRRKTKHPFCKDDPNCVWNNHSCKKKPNTNNGKRDHSQEKSNAKLNMIIHKLNHIESMLHKMTLKNKKKQTKTKTRSTVNRNNKNNNWVSAKTASPTNVANLLNSQNNNSMSEETASPTNVKKLLNRQNNNLTVETVSSSAANRLKELINQN